MTRVGCDGSEDSIFTCPFSGWGVRNCSHREEASVICSGIVSIFSVCVCVCVRVTVCVPSSNYSVPKNHVQSYPYLMNSLEMFLFNRHAVRP